MKFVVLGESLVDVATGRATSQTSTPGGSPMNVAVGLRRLDQDVTLVTHIGADEHGASIRDHLGRNGVVILSDPDGGGSATSVAEAVVHADGSATYEFSITWDIQTVLAEAREAVAAAAAVHCGSIATHLRPGSEDAHELFRSARSNALTSYDPNCRPSIIGDAETARIEVERFVAESDVIKASDEDVRWLYPGKDYREVASSWLASGALLVVITRGEDGAWCQDADGVAVDVRGTRVDVVDTVGAGDSFMAALLFGLAERGLLGADKGRILGLGAGELTAIIRQAISASALTCTRPGANPPTRARLLAAR